MTPAATCHARGSGRGPESSAVMRAASRPARGRRPAMRVQHVVVAGPCDDGRDERGVRMSGGLDDQRVASPRDLGARDDRERDVEARHGRDRVVEAKEERVLEVEPADLGERVHEAVEHARRRGRQKEEDRLRAHVREQAGAPEAVVPVVAAPEEQDEPADRERHVEEAVADVEAVDEARVAQERTLHGGLDVEP